MMAGRLRRRRGDRGATLVEAALVTPVFVLVVFGIFEFGLLLRSHLTMSAATSASARAASVASNGAPADHLVLRSLEHGLQAIGSDKLDFVVVYRADGSDDDVPAACLSGSVDGGPGGVACNRYTTADMVLAYTDADGHLTGNWGCEPTSRDNAFCPLDRSTEIAAPGPDYVGIYVQARHEYITGVLGDEVTLTDNTIVRLEPKLVRNP